ncbi:MAG: hypothetical protein Q4C55_05730 [Eubacterium sp.]|nr:hypothetical protein [Eubacterium sp.]
MMDAALEKLFDIFESRGKSLYIVGGAVRDMLLGEHPKDYDLTTDATPQEMEGWFDEVITLGKSYGTIGVLMEGRVYEITTFRRETLYTDGRHPDGVAFTDDPREDVSRRDFTVNGLLMDRRGVIFDYVGGLRDIKDGVVRCIGSPEERFDEDRLRKWRGIRLAAEKGLEVDDALRKAIEENPTTEGVSVERIAQELNRILMSPKVAWGGYLLVRTGLLAELFNRSVPAFVSRCEDYLIDSFEIMVGQPAALELRLAALVLNMLPEERKTFLRAMHYSSRLTDQVLKLCDYVLVDCTDVVKFKGCLAELGRQEAIRLLEFRKSIAEWNRDAACAKKVEANIQAWQRIEAAGEPLLLSELAVSGREVAALGYSGPEIAAALNRLLEYVYLHPEENQRDRLLARLEREDHGKTDLA